MNWFKWLHFVGLYYRQPRWDTGISPPELIAFLESHPASRALDLGCGTGTNAITMAGYGWQVTGVDFVGRAIRAGRRKAKAAGIEVDLRTGDVTNLEGIHGTFQLVLDIGCFHSLSLSQRQAYLENIDSLLEPGGSFLIYLFVKDSLQQGGPGLVEDELLLIEQHLQLVERSNGTERGERSSAWLRYINN
jgi:SAM-dependent methyltransferase